MAYTAFEKMRKFNRGEFGRDLGPMQPALYVNRRNRNDLKSAALRFLHERCEGLQFDADEEKQENWEKGIFRGTSLKAGQIPYNMQMDINRLCLEKSLETFIDSGVAEDAYAVYYCYLEIFFDRYGNAKKMVELLSEYELNGSSLLMKHRDHYSHSVYVFALGLALYETNATYRNIFRNYYGIESPDESEAANQFLELWGLTSLFHDIGYPFELPFEQVLSYFEVNNQERDKIGLYLSYRAVDSLTELDEDSRARWKKEYGRDFSTMTELFAFDLTRKMGVAYNFTEDYLLGVLNAKPTDPKQFGCYMDHAFFSAVRLYAELARALKPQNLTARHVDALTAILLHNSLYKFSIAFYKSGPDKRREPLRAEVHPLAWLLMLCDELQCWDRTAYGRKSRTELHPVSATFDFSNGAVTAEYFYDAAEKALIGEFEEKLGEWTANPDGKKKPRLKAYSDMAGEKPDFTKDIESIVNTSFAPLTVSKRLTNVDRKRKHTYLSESNFLHLYDFAVMLHARSMPVTSSMEEMEQKFISSSLEYQLSTLNRARNFARYLNAIRCFYTDKPVDFEPVMKFTPGDAAVFAPLEHERWVREHQAMGWRYSDAYVKALPVEAPPEQEQAARSALRERLRCHKLTMDGKLTHEDIREHYRKLSKADQGKDWKPFNKLLQLMKMHDGLRIYRLQLEDGEQAAKAAQSAR